LTGWSSEKDVDLFVRLNATEFAYFVAGQAEDIGLNRFGSGEILGVSSNIDKIGVNSGYDIETRLQKTK
jgi:imidazole glycerol phosphate synthase subunit HisF